MKQFLLNINPCNFICAKMFGHLKKQSNLDDIELEKLYLGIMVIVFNISELILVFITAFFVGILKEVLLLFIMFAALRITAAGLHFRSNLVCLITTITSYIGSAYISKNFPINISSACLVSFICGILLFKYAPADTEKRPILGEKHRKRLKILTTIIVLILVAINLILLNKVLFNLTMFSLIIEALSVLPCSYKLIKENYNNYKKYELA